MAKEEKIEVLFLEDDAGDQLLVTHALRKTTTRINVHCVESIEGAMAALRHAEFDVIIADLTLAGCDLQTNTKMISMFIAENPVIVMSGNEDKRLAEELVEAGCHAYLVKGIESFEMLEQIIYSAIEF